MRPKVVAFVLLAAGLVLAGMFYFKRPAPEPVTAPAADRPAPPGPVLHAPPVRAVAPQPAPGPAITATVATNFLTPEQRQDAIDAKVESLQQLSMSDDPGALPGIVTELTNSEKEIREAAVAAIRELDDSNAIPALKAAADHTADLQEKIALLEAADFLTVPPMNVGEPSTPLTPEQIQALEQQRAEKLAHRQARMQGTSPNTDPQTGSPTPAPAPTRNN